MRTLLVIVILLAMLAIGYFLSKVHQKRMARVVTQNELVPKRAVVETPPPTKAPTKPPTIRLHLHKSSGCKDQGPELSLAFADSDIDEFRQGKDVERIFDTADSCFQVGPISIGPRRKLKQGLVARYLSKDETVDITDISEMPLAKVSLSFISDAQFRPPEAPDRKLDVGEELKKQGYLPESIVAVLNFSPSRPLRPKGRYEKYLLSGLGFARTIMPEQLEKERQAEANVVDIRSPAAFKRNHYAGAVNIPYVADPRVMGENTIYDTFSKLDKFVLPKSIDKNKLLIIIGESEEKQIFAIRALATAKVNGYEKLGYLAGGEAARNGIDELVPAYEPGIKVIDVREAEELYATRARFIGVLRPDIVREYGYIKGDIIPYKDDSEFPTQLSLQVLRSLGDSFAIQKLPANKNVSLVFYGTDDHDWTPLKAAIWARDSGYKDSYVFGGGLEKWPKPLVESAR